MRKFRPAMGGAVQKLSRDGRGLWSSPATLRRKAQTGALCFDHLSGQVQAVQTFREPQDFSGTGDLFASVLTGGLVGGIPLFQAAQAAAEFVRAL